MWILFDTPLLVIEMHISNDAGFVSAIQSICMVLRLFSWFGGFIVLWIAILEKASGWLHKRSDCDPDIVEALRQKRR
ncbi:hypothetical protein DIPPA_26476 [Diplonema papillatum]|nr:hypothetical protein DIPPA_26476 [Diplonema papillatum]